MRLIRTALALFKGGGNTTPVGPAVQPAGRWTVSTAPAKITTTNYGTLVGLSWQRHLHAAVPVVGGDSEQ